MSAKNDLILHLMCSTFKLYLPLWPNCVSKCLHLENIKLRSCCNQSKSFFFKPQSLKSSISNDRFRSHKKSRHVLFVSSQHLFSDRKISPFISVIGCLNMHKALVGWYINVGYSDYTQTPLSSSTTNMPIITPVFTIPNITADS